MPRWMQFMLFISIALSIWGAIHFYVYHRILSYVALAGNLELSLRSAFLVLFALYPLATILNRAHLGSATGLLSWTANLWVGILFLLFVFLIIAQIGGTVAHWGGLSDRLRPLSGPRPGLALLSAIAALTLVVSGYGICRAAAPARIVSFDAPLKNLPDSLVGFKIVQISDLHLGAIVGRNRLSRMVTQVNLQDPDLVVITGDLADEAASHLERLVGLLAQIRSRHGILAVTGNHDFYAGVDGVVALAQSAGVRFMRNEKIVIAGNLHVYGIDDPTVSITGEMPVAMDQIIGAEAREHPSVLLYHQPLRYEMAEKLGIDLMLSGHTHNGQIWPFSYLVRIPFKRNHGMYRNSNGSIHYVSCGIGTWGPPMRIGAPPEIVVIRLQEKSR